VRCRIGGPDVGLDLDDPPDSDLVDTSVADQERADQGARGVERVAGEKVSIERAAPVRDLG
jgi:hypothetical protein